MVGETHGELAVIVIAVHVDDGAEAVGWMADALADEGIGVALYAAARAEPVRSNPRGALPRGSRRAADAAREFLGGIGVFGVGFVAARFAGFGERAFGGIDEIRRNFLQEA